MPENGAESPAYYDHIVSHFNNHTRFSLVCVVLFTQKSIYKRDDKPRNPSNTTRSMNQPVDWDFGFIAHLLRIYNYF